MKNTTSHFVPHSKSTYMVTVSSYEEHGLAGRLYSPFLERTFSFHNLMQLLLLVDSLMDELNFPQRVMEQRFFLPEQEVHALRESAQQEDGPHLASFKINVLFRQNASWQGVVVWNECAAEAHFRSVLELIGLLDDALTAAQAQK